MLNSYIMSNSWTLNHICRTCMLKQLLNLSEQTLPTIKVTVLRGVRMSSTVFNRFNSSFNLSNMDTNSLRSLNLYPSSLTIHHTTTLNPTRTTLARHTEMNNTTSTVIRLVSSRHVLCFFVKRRPERILHSSHSFRFNLILHHNHVLMPAVLSSLLHRFRVFQEATAFMQTG